MKKIIIMSLLMVSTVAFAKVEEPKIKTEVPKNDEKVLVSKKDIKGEKISKKIKIKTLRDPFQQCVLNNSIGMWAVFFYTGVQVEGEVIEALATVQCMKEFQIIP